MNKFRGFSDYAQPIGSRWRLMGLPDPQGVLGMFSGLDFTPSPELGNHQSKLLKSVGRPVLSLFYFCHYRSIQIIKDIIAQFRKGRKPYRASPDSSPVLKYGVFSGGFL